MGVLAAALIATVAAACGTPVGSGPTWTTIGRTRGGAPTARPVPPDPAVGAVFLGGGWLHTCSAAVLDSRGR